MAFGYARRAGARVEGKERRGGLLRLILEVVLIAWVIRSFIFAPFSIPSGSMLPALYIGDYVLVAKWPYGYSRFSFPWGFPSFEGRMFERLPKRGDVVVFKLPRDDSVHFIKRVIGLPGDEQLAEFKELPHDDTIPSLCELSVADVEDINARVWAPRWTLGLQDDLVKQVQAEGRRVIVWTLDEPSYISQFIEQGSFNGILSNYPSLIAYNYYVKE